MKIGTFFNAEPKFVALRNRASVAADFSRMNVRLSEKSLSYLTVYPNHLYSAMCKRLILDISLKTKGMEWLVVDPPEKMSGVNFDNVPESVLHRRLSFLTKPVKGMALDLRGLRGELAEMVKRSELPRQLPDNSRIIEPPAKPIIFSPEATNGLTPDLLLDPKQLDPKYPYPQRPEEYQSLINFVTNGSGVFPGDQEPLSHVGYFDTKQLRSQGVKVYRFNRGGYDFVAVFFNPGMHARQFRNGSVFDADLLSQMATHGDTGQVGCSYPRPAYYDGRFFASDVVGFVFHQSKYGSMPVSFAAISNNHLEIDGHPLNYAFIHFVMTAGGYQRLRLTNYIVTEILTSMFWQNMRHFRRDNLFINKNGEIQRTMLKMWTLCHTGRIPAIHTFLNSFRTTGPELELSKKIIRAMVFDADGRAYGERGDRPLIEVPGMPFAWRDVGVYDREENRYPLNEDGSVKIPPKTRQLPSFQKIKQILGDEEGLKQGNAAYLAGVVDISAIRAHERREREKLGDVGSVDGVRGSIVKNHT